MYGTVLVALVLVIIAILGSSYMTYYFMKQTYEKMIKHTKDVLDRFMSASDCDDVELDFEDDEDDDEEDGDGDGGRFRPTNRVSEHFN